MDFVAIDFETANFDPNSICAVGLVVIKNGEFIKKYKKLIQPPNNEYENFHSSLHNIYPKDTVNEPTFDKAFQEIYSYIGENLVLAHNASFDMGALRHTLSYYDICYPNLYYLCTKFLSQKIWEKRVSYSLDSLSNDFNIILDHHDPLSDALACAEIAIKGCTDKNINNINELAEKFNLRIGKIFKNGYSPCRLNNKHTKLKVKDLKPTLDSFDEDSPIFGNSFVFTGTLESMLRKDAWQKVLDAGGNCTDNVTKNTNFLVLGLQDYSKFRSGDKSNKHKKAESLITMGKSIEIISEDEFIRMLIH